LNNDQKKIIQSLQDSYFQATEKIKAFGKTKLPENSKNINIILKREVKELRNDLSMAEFDKSGLDFSQIYENCLIPQRLKCSFCNKKGHHESFCFHKKRKLEGNPEQSISEHALERSSSLKRKECSYCKRLGHLELNSFLKIKHLEIKKIILKGPTSSWVPKEPLTQNAGILTRCKNKAMVLGQIKGKGIIGKKDSAKIEDVQYVEGLKHNLLSISQLCDSGFEVVFKSNICIVKHTSSGKIFFTASRKKNLYALYLDDIPAETCFMTLEKDKWIWHKRARHISMKTISKISKLDLVRGLPKIDFEKDRIYEACTRGKQVKSSFKTNDFVSTKRPLELLHIDLFGPVRTASLSGKQYGFVIVDDFSRYMWVLFLKHKDEAFEAFKTFCILVQNEKESKIISVRSNHGGEFENAFFKNFFDEKGIFHNFSCARTPQQNGVVERKNRTL